VKKWAKWGEPSPVEESAETLCAKCPNKGGKNPRGRIKPLLAAPRVIAKNSRAPFTTPQENPSMSVPKKNALIG